MSITRLAPPERGVTRILLLRHSEPIESIKGRCYGRLDPELSNRGRAQAVAMGEALADTSITAVFSSPRQRAQESARIVMKASDRAAMPFEVDDRFSELDFGEIEGMSYDEVRAQRPDLYRAWMSAPTRVEFPGGENYAGLRRRVLEGLMDIRENPDFGVVLLVAHGGVLRAILAEALGIPEEHIFRLAQDYAGLSCIDCHQDSILVPFVNWSVQ